MNQQQTTPKETGFEFNGQAVEMLYQEVLAKGIFPDMPKNAIGKTFPYEGATYTVKGIYFKGISQRSKTVKLKNIQFLCEVGIEEYHTFTIDFVSSINLADPIT